MKSIRYCAAGLLVITSSLAQFSGEGFEITNNTIDGGGGLSSGGDFTVTGTIGQHDATAQVSSRGNFALAGGFWANATIADEIFHDGFESP
jgi:hypothetical protein